MKKTGLDDNKRRFCRTYLATMDAETAAADCGAADCGAADGWEMLGQKDVQRYLERARTCAAQAVRPEDIARHLCRIAFSRPNDAVALACGCADADVQDMDLLSVAEFKYRDGCAEVKFCDRVRALQALAELLRSEHEDDDTAREFFQALQDSAAVPPDGSGESG